MLADRPDCDELTAERLPVADRMVVPPSEPPTSLRVPSAERNVRVPSAERILPVFVVRKEVRLLGVPDTTRPLRPLPSPRLTVRALPLRDTVRWFPTERPPEPAVLRRPV